MEKGYVKISSKNGLIGKSYKFPKITVTGTSNLIMSSVLSDGKATTLKNCAIEPEVLDLTNFLKNAGANIKWIGKRTCQIIGVNSLNEISYSVMGDRIETGTFCVAATLTKGNFLPNNVHILPCIQYGPTH